MRIQKGIREILYKTKDGTQRKYRVRVNTKDFVIDKLFDSLDEARNCINLAKSKDGQKAISEFTLKEKLEKEAIEEYLASPTIEVYLGIFYKKYLLDESSPTKKISSRAYFSRIEGICRQKLKVNKNSLIGYGAILKNFAKGNEILEFGEMKPEDINEAVASDFIIERLKGRKVVTVKTEVGLLQSFFNKLRYIDLKTWERLKLNPFKEADKTKLKNKGTKRERRLNEGEEEALLKSLGECVNPEMKWIFCLAIETGMRRGEILELKWVNLKKRRITVEDSKSGSRNVVLSEQALKIIEQIPKKDVNIFHYTSWGFNANWARVKKRAGVTNFRFHDCRREFISRIIDKVSSPIAISGMSSLRDPNHIERHYLEPLRSERASENETLSEEEALKSIGHKDRKTTSVYYSRKVDDE